MRASLCSSNSSQRTCRQAPDPRSLRLNLRTAVSRNNAGQPAVQLSPEEQAKIGLQITEVRRESITEEILAIGRVEEPETAIATVSTRFGGKIEKLFVNFTGQPVQSGDPIATISITGQAAGRDDPVSSIYSRDLIAAAEEYRFASAESRPRSGRLPARRRGAGGRSR